MENIEHPRTQLIRDVTYHLKTCPFPMSCRSHTSTFKRTRLVYTLLYGRITTTPYVCCNATILFKQQSGNKTENLRQ